MVKATTDEPYNFVCFTDTTEKLSKGIERIELSGDRPGWWAKTEIFQLKGKTIYFDLDTLILTDFTKFNLSKGDFIMLKAFNPRRTFASGAMAWEGDFSFLYEDYTDEDAVKFKWDQKYIIHKLETSGIIPQTFQERGSKIYSYKRHCLSGIPTDADLICFHGVPRPIDVPLLWDTFYVQDKVSHHAD